MKRYYNEINHELVNSIFKKDDKRVEEIYNYIKKNLSKTDFVIALYSYNAFIFSNFDKNCFNNFNSVFMDNIKKIKDGDISPEIFLSYIDVVKEKESSGNDYISRAFEYIEDNLDKDLNLEALAKELHISKNYFSNLFKKVAGTRFCRYVNIRRIEYSKKLLTSTDLHLDVIAQRCGYNSQSHFSTTFLKYVKTSPGAYRHAYKLKQREEREKDLFNNPIFN